MQMRQTPEISYQPAVVDDEIDLRELVSTVIDGWYWVVGCVVLAIVLAFGFTQLRPHTWQTEFDAKAASPSLFALTNSLLPSESGLPGMSLQPEAVLTDFADRLGSFRNFKAYLANTPGVDLPDDTRTLSFFRNNLNLTQQNDERRSVQAALTYGGELDGPAFLNGYVRATAEALWADYLGQLSRTTSVGMAQLARDIERARGRIIEEKNVRLAELDQAITVARDLGLAQPSTLGQTSTDATPVIPNRAVEKQLPLYLLGYETLEAERAALAEAEPAFADSAALRTLQAHQERYHQVRAWLDEGKLAEQIGLAVTPPPERLVRVLDYAVEPVSPAGTSGKLILVAAVILGGFLGLILTFVVHFTRSVMAYRAQR